MNKVLRNWRAGTMEFFMNQLKEKLFNYLLTFSIIYDIM